MPVIWIRAFMTGLILPLNHEAEARGCALDSLSFEPREASAWFLIVQHEGDCEQRSRKRCSPVLSKTYPGQQSLCA